MHEFMIRSRWTSELHLLKHDLGIGVTLVLVGVPSANARASQLQRATATAGVSARR